jgi:sirohydrochlorin cobaltochelatase
MPQRPQKTSTPRARGKKRAAASGTFRVKGIILFAHGSRNPAWRKPFDRVLADIAKRYRHAVLAFGEFMSPGLVEAAQLLAKQGVKRAVIVPLLLGGGLHVRGDLPKLAAQAKKTSGLTLRIAPAIGEDAGVLNAIARYSVSVAATKRRVRAKRARVTSTRRKPS